MVRRPLSRRAPDWRPTTSAEAYLVSVEEVWAFWQAQQAACSHLCDCAEVSASVDTAVAHAVDAGGWSLNDVAASLGVAVSTVRRRYRRHSERDSLVGEEVE